MKKSVIFMLLSAAAFCSCQREFAVETPSADTHRHVIFVADAAQTKTSMSYDDETKGYNMTWDVGDRISIFEYAPGFDYPVRYSSEMLTESDISNNGQTARFRVILDEASGSDFQYVAVYPDVFSGGYEPECNYISWDAKGAFDVWSNDWGYDGPDVDPHLLVRAVLPFEQSPSADCFDPSANTMVSKVIKSDGQIENFAELRFARIGSILRISFKGLTDYVGKQVTEAVFGFGDSFGGDLICDYDTYLEKYKFYKGFNQIRLIPESVIVDQEGCADLWIRCYAGEITDWFSLYITLDDAGGGKGKGEPVTLGKYVDLASLSRSVVIPEGKMAKFSVASWGVVDVQSVQNINYSVNPEMDGFTVIWEDVENAAGYNFWYYADNNPEERVKVEVEDYGNGKHCATVAGLTPDYYNLIIIPVPADGHALIDPNYYYPVRIPVGIEVEKNIYNTFFTMLPDPNVSSYEYEGLSLNYKNIRQSGNTLATAKNEWSLWNTAEFCNSISSLIFIADEWTATESQQYIDRNSTDHMIRPMDYVTVLASSGSGNWVSIAPEYGEPFTQGGYVRYPITYTFPQGTKYFRVSSDEERLEQHVPQVQNAPASLMCTFFSIRLMIYE